MAQSEWEVALLALEQVLALPERVPGLKVLVLEQWRLA
jgi:hypothetical protein